MKQIFTISVFLLLFVSSFGQNMDKGIYMGKKPPFTVCYLTYTDSIIEVEFFYEKSSQIFGHTAPKKLKLGKKSSSIQPILISNDDSIKVYSKTNHLLIKRKGYGKIKAYKTSHTQAHIQTLRNRQKLFSFSQKLSNENGSNSESQNFWNKLNSYHLDQKTNLTEEEFEIALKKVEEEMKKWLQ